MAGWSKFTLVAILLSLFVGTEAYSEDPIRFPPDLERSPLAHSPASPHRMSSFAGPNERHTTQLIPLIANAPEGIHVSVGTERGFIGAGLNAGATDLVLVDHEPTVVWYNRINIALLQMAKDREDYLRLRLGTPVNEWGNLAKESGLDADTVKLLSKPDLKEIWLDMMFLSSDFRPFERKPGWRNGYAFDKANYLHYDDQFARVSKLAKAGRITALLTDLKNPNDVQRITDAMKASGRKLSVVDLSNAWWDARDYLGAKGTEAIIQALDPIALDDSRLIFTERVAYKKFTFKNLWRRFNQDFCYHAFCFDLARDEGVKELVWAMETGVLPDGQLFSRGSPCAPILSKLLGK